MNNFKDYTIYPSVEINEKRGIPYYFKIETCIRKKHEGKWYLWRVIETCDSFKVKNDCIKRFIRMCYIVILFGIVDPNTKNMEGVDTYILDNNQESEEERLSHYKSI